MAMRVIMFKEGGTYDRDAEDLLRKARRDGSRLAPPSQGTAPLFRTREGLEERNKVALRQGEVVRGQKVCGEGAVTGGAGILALRDGR